LIPNKVFRFQCFNLKISIISLSYKEQLLRLKDKWINKLISKSETYFYCTISWFNMRMNTNFISGLSPLDTRHWTHASGLWTWCRLFGLLSCGLGTLDSGLWTLDMGLSGIFNPSPVMFSSKLIKLIEYTKIVMYTRVLYS